jgi:hypothetical protein
MSVDLPGFLKSGEAARLIPVANGPQRERCAASVLLATFAVVQPFARAAFATLRKNVGSMTSISTFTEVVFRKQPSQVNCRPDGLIVLSTPKSQWRALVEAKIGLGKIEPDQLAAYSRLAAENGIDAIITISNELTSFPEHPPYAVPQNFARKVELYHWSWMKLVTLATMLLSSDEEFDQEQHFILKEMLRYFSHENTDVRGFHQMNPEWQPLLERLHSGAEISRSDVDVVKTVLAWHQEQNDICLLLSRKLRVPVTLRLRKYHRDNQSVRLEHDSEEFASSKRLRAVFDIPNLAGPVEVIADALKRNIHCMLSVQAPEDRKRYESRLSWLLRQLPAEPGASVGVHVRWKNGGSTYGSLAELRDSPKVADIDRPNTLPKSFDIVAVTDLGRKFSGPKSFIDFLEAAVPQFYDGIASHIRAWQPGPVSGPLEGEESLAETVANLPDPKRPPSRIVKRGQVGSGRFAVFEDGSIEIETPSGTRRFKDMAELSAFTAKTNPAKKKDQSSPDRPQAPIGVQTEIPLPAK